MAKIKPHHVHLICNAKYHDTDFARSELVNLFSEHDDLGVSISQDYSDFYKFKDSDLLITYTCDLSPAQEEVDTLREFLNNGGKWFGLHGTNALIEFVGEMQIVDGLEIGGNPKVVLPCEPQLGKRNLYPNISQATGEKHPAADRMDILTYCDGTNNAFEISSITNIEIKKVIEELKLLIKYKLVSI